MRIGIVNQFAGAAALLDQLVRRDPANRVIWIALTGPDALERCAKETPDLVLMDMAMPGMDGVETIRRLMASTPCAILIVTASLQLQSNQIGEALNHGALDAVATPVLGGREIADIARPLLTRIATISRLIGKRPGRFEPGARDNGVPPPAGADRLIAIGSSAGGPAALATILRDLPEDFPGAVVIVQHVDERFADGLAAWLDQGTALTVRVAKEGDRPAIGTVLLAGTTDHLTLKTADRVGYTPDPVDYVYRPSVDVFFHSACRLWRGEIVGVLLTGMGHDGAIGLKALRDGGHHTIAQDQATCAVYGMPKAAAELHAAMDVLPCGQIGAKLIALLNGRSGSPARPRQT